MYASKVSDGVPSFVTIATMRVSPSSPPMSASYLTPGYSLSGYPGAGGVLYPQPPSSPTNSQARNSQGSHSAQASPTNTLKTVRPRARSADESVSSKKVNFQTFLKFL